MGMYDRIRGSEYGRRARFGAVGLLVIVALVIAFVVYPLPYGAALRGVVLGMLTALLALGLALVYRANRVLNFAQADLGSVPTSFAVALVVFSHWPYPLGFVVGLVIAIVLGGLVELIFVRRFKNASRLVLTVATLGITQLLVVLGILVPRWWGRNAASERLPQMFTFKVDIGVVRLLSNDFVALVVAPVAMVLVALFLNRTRTGIAVRAAAERGDRANMLGIPVARLSTIVWALAAALSFVSLYLRAGILGVPIGSAFDVTNLLYAMAALVIGRLQNLFTIAVAGVCIGFLDYWVTWHTSSPLLVVPMVSVAVLVALLLQRRSTSRRDTDATSSWRGAEEVRPLDADTARLPWVRVARWGSAVVVAGVVVALPLVLRVDRLIQANEVVVFCVIGISLMILTGWAGQISLGQMGFVAVGGAVSALCTSRWNVDLSLALLIGAVAGALAALLVGLPALRLQGLYLAVTTLAFGLSVTSWLLNDRFFGWVPIGERLHVAPLFGRVDIDTPTRFYAYSLIVLGIVVLLVRGVRRSRTGRVIVAMRENERAAQSFSIAPVRAKLTAFMLSGAVAGVAGGLLVHMNHSFSLSQYGADQSFGVFTSAIIGGLGSITGVIVGAVFSRATLRLPTLEWRLLSTSFGVLLILLVLPGGLGSQVTKLRDLIARAALKRRAGAPSEPASTDAATVATTEVVGQPDDVAVESGVS
ncbi:MAG: ABC-type branched-chain amino acid transport system, permease component [Ilumatobacteraceae bacterium]|nr:ABC-type branched-chain amino acid transport system, permease component [Ilumatobacteraceae bacterium]